MDVDEADPPPPKPPVVNAAKPATTTPPSETFARQSAVVSEPQKLKDAIDAVGGALRERMKFYKLHYSANAAGQCASFNADPTNKPEIIADHNDPHRIDWLTAKDPNVVVGDNVWRAGDPDEWLVRWPILKGFNASAYTSGSLHEALGDIEVIWSEVLKSRLNIGRKDYGLYSVMLVVPDIPDQTYIPSMLRLLLGSMGFKQAVIMQESLAATYGAGLSTALVVDVGANATNIACVDEGFVVPDTRISLDVGGDDITELLIRLLARSQVPWAQTADLARVDDFATAERLKIQLATLAEEHVALNLHEFVVRSHGKPAVKCKMKTYEEPALAGMTPFETQGVDYTAKFRTTWAQFPGASSAIDDGFAEPNDGITQAMIFSTQHLAATGMAHIDIPREAAKLPLDVAIFNSARAAGPEDKMRRALTAVLLVGGGLAKIKGVNGALETRLNAIANGRVPGLERVLVVGPTKHVDPRVLCWKGASVFARMDTVQEFWVSKDEWEMVGMRGVRERWWFLS
ncbi:actin-like ATPase domain-containing protein [Auriculariales sp. MPI-PUGE-AT-0066]|nr:actin-like ATPase domain-containing protein [Auriculariales sp. MPI-PUGE-AT-0066]